MLSRFRVSKTVVAVRAYKCQTLAPNFLLILQSCPCTLFVNTMSEVGIKAWKCDRAGCSHVWGLHVGPEKGKPKRCAKCKSPYWDVDKPSNVGHRLGSLAEKQGK